MDPGSSRKWRGGLGRPRSARGFRPCGRAAGKPRGAPRELQCRAQARIGDGGVPVFKAVRSALAGTAGSRQSELSSSMCAFLLIVILILLLIANAEEKTGEWGRGLRLRLRLRLRLGLGLGPRGDVTCCRDFAADGAAGTSSACGIHGRGSPSADRSPRPVGRDGAGSTPGNTRSLADAASPARRVDRCSCPRG